MRLIGLVSGLVLAGCASTIVPTEGEWSYQGLEYTADTCGAGELATTSVATLEALVLTMALTDEGFEVSLPGGDPVAMVQDGNDFSGTTGLTWDVTTWEDADGNDVEADLVLNMDATLSGTFSDENTASFTAELEGTCEGEECEDYMGVNGVQENPCSATLVGELVAQ
jgi:hypothetical protein